jgi:DNA-binding NtrC family response regulator
MPIEVPPLGIRETELPRIIQAYADESMSALDAPASCFSEDDRDWVMKHGARSISEIEKATLRIVALNMTNNSHQAAKVLRMAQVSLSRWLGRRMPRRPARLG